MTTEVDKVLSEIKAGFNEYKKQVFEETKREVLDSAMAKIKKQCAEGYNGAIFRLYDKGKANKVKFLLERLGFTCSVDQLKIDECDREREVYKYDLFDSVLWTERSDVRNAKYVFFLNVEWSFDYE
ncbi:hypothetical protein [Pasteurella multocida]|uniref:hypothetical protein n=1 Tax=Pasteurella multocida TaxID=747 RepID=UPI00064C859F|nr:hypothetical protein [Pasteurella multocida]KLT48590.1 hypothetical protein PVACC_02370 [Pasteurella multocida subsp. multocida]KLT52906.1 hypothetical protein PMMV1_02370 [Pasteurella multocida subsp. multocida]KLT58269.1 hypothetical protein ISLM_02365 [Pasteurella multocida subsp. multocida]KLT62909.1 hypothetical protein PESH_02370 [Pasteurella multocida subsp. multocida]KLU28287.1 hypothetical protein ATTK_11020 [Pasteurella multocida subsp. multocida]